MSLAGSKFPSSSFPDLLSPTSQSGYGSVLIYFICLILQLFYVLWTSTEKSDTIHSFYHEVLDILYIIQEYKFMFSGLHIYTKLQTFAENCILFRSFHDVLNFSSHPGFGIEYRVFLLSIFSSKRENVRSSVSLSVQCQIYEILNILGEYCSSVCCEILLGRSALKRAEKFVLCMTRYIEL